MLVAAVYLALRSTVLAPVDKHGARLVHLELQSKAVGRTLGVNVIVPPRAGQRGKRWLLVFLHGRGGSETSFNDPVFEGLPDLHGRRGMVVAFPDGGEHGYWHDRAEGDWGTYVMDEVIPTVVKRFGVDPKRIAIGGISMGGFGALDLALAAPRPLLRRRRPLPRALVQGLGNGAGGLRRRRRLRPQRRRRHRPGRPERLRRHPRLGRLRRIRRPFLPYDEGFVAAMEAGGADFTHRSWPGGHEESYWAAHWPQYQRFYLKALRDC